MSNRNASNGERHPHGESPTADRNGQTPSAMNAARPAFFANRVLRLAIKTTLAQHLGPDVFGLLTVIVMTEDARRYRGPVAFYNDQLLPLVGFAKWDRLEKARRKAIDAGWLLHEPGGRHRPGLYRGAIPKELGTVEDAPVDEGPAFGEGYQAGYEAGYRAGFEAGRDAARSPFAGIERESDRGSSGGTAGDQRGEREGEPSCPVPIPKTSTSTKDDAATKRDVEAVEVLLSEAGITTAGTTARLAVERGYTANHVRELLDYLGSHRDSFVDWKAALVFRLKNSPPATSVDQGWPPSKSKPRTPEDTRRADQFRRDFRRLGTADRQALCERAGLAESQFALCLEDPKLLRKLMAQWEREHSPREQDDKPP